MSRVRVSFPAQNRATSAVLLYPPMLTGASMFEAPVFFLCSPKASEKYTGRCFCSRLLVLRPDNASFISKKTPVGACRSRGWPRSLPLSSSEAVLGKHVPSDRRTRDFTALTVSPSSIVLPRAFRSARILLSFSYSRHDAPSTEFGTV